MAVYLRYLFAAHAGPLWRDEANSAALVTDNSVAGIWNRLEFDSFPIVWFVLLKAWLLAFGDSDAAMRVLGFVISVGVLAIYFAVGRATPIRWPLFSIMAVGLAPSMVEWGGSNRATGLGVLTFLLMALAYWKMVETLSAKRLAIAILASVVAVQTSWYNAPLLAALTFAGLVVFLLACKRTLRSLLPLIVPGLLSGLSLIPYVPMFRRLRKWSVVYTNNGTNFRWVLRHFLYSVRYPVPLLFDAWLIFAAAAAALTIGLIWRHLSQREAGGEPDFRVFSACFAAASVVVYLGFLVSLHYATSPWYYLILTAAVALGIDGIVMPFALERRTLAPVTAGLALGLSALMVHACAAHCMVRMTNMDEIASTLQAKSRPGDLILVTPWYMGVSFARYYHGPAQWTTVPPIAFHKWHRFDLIKSDMAQPDAVASDLSLIKQCLSSGKRVYVVGELPDVAPGEAMPQQTTSLKLATRSEEWPYDELWGVQAAVTMQRHAAQNTYIAVPTEQNIRIFEECPLESFAGWKR